MMTPKEAKAAGFVVDTTCYPWVAYKGPRFMPDEWHKILTDREANLLQAAKGLLFACQHHGIRTGTMEFAAAQISEAEGGSK